MSTRGVRLPHDIPHSRWPEPKQRDGHCSSAVIVDSGLPEGSHTSPMALASGIVLWEAFIDLWRIAS